ncbi:CFEM domain-containing protein [Fusarium keratoplasticum]|uniref:CFEM domain-containing protein n=1 Tax=Fusarium keratoplasticum TaxID=1328300 RepID=A0ACC0RA90_9HYPO|nr:CFEM domain-containing protein [Fusarium keratoplasticum]KAI8664506.1 CFEM domain-containing protein [Fusarium keratoplasticum]KAI8675881.1 CFEM domain-containing protein [Fusarium keratoplasticum]
MKSVIITAVLASAGALAQSPLPACAQSCALSILASSGCASTDVACVCKSTVFVAGYTSCVTKACSAEDAAKAEQYGVQLCGSAGVSVSGEAPATEAPAVSSEAPEAPSAPTEAPSAPSAPAAPSAPEAPTAPSAPAPPYPPKPSEEVPPVVPTESKPTEVPATPATPTPVIPTAGAGMVQVSNAIILSVGLSMMLVLLN